MTTQDALLLIAFFVLLLFALKSIISAAMRKARKKLQNRTTDNYRDMK
jgi:hypothetical protein